MGCRARLLADPCAQGEQAVLVADRSRPLPHAPAQLGQRRPRVRPLRRCAVLRVARRGASQAALDRAVGEDEALEQRVRGEPVGAVHAGGGALAAGVEAGDRGRAVEVGGDAAHQVVGRGCDRDADRSDRSRPAWAHPAAMFGKRARTRSRSRCASVRYAPSPEAISASIARVTTSLGASSASGCTSGHEPVPVAVHEPGALAAHRLGDQERAPAGGEARSGGTGRTPCRARSAPARWARAMPSPVAPGGLVVRA